MEFDKWYKHQIESNMGNPPDEAWEGVQNTLDTDLVWNRVVAELDAREKSRAISLWAAAASLLLLIAAGSMFYFFSMSGDSPYAQQPAQQIGLPMPARMEQISVSQPLAGAQPLFQRPGIVRHDHRQPVHDRPAEPETSPIPDEPGTITASMNPLPSAGLRSGPAFIAEIMPPYDRTAQLQIIEQIPEEDPTPKPRFYIGISGQLANTWVVDGKTTAGLRNSDLTATRTSYGQSAGIVAGKMISDRIGLQFAFDFTSVKRQDYMEYIHGHYVATSLDMDYSKFSVLTNVQLRPNSPHQAVMGFYTGYLKNAENHIGGQVESVNSQYARFDYGLIAGYEYVRTLGDPLQLGMGAFANYGLPNVFAGDENIPGYLNKTKLLSFHLAFSLRYTFAE